MTQSSDPPRPRRFDLVVFDWDGTLYDSTAAIVQSIQAAASDLGLEPPDDQRAAFVIGLGLRAALEHAVPGLAPERYPLMAERYRHHYFARRNDLALFPGVLDMLHALRRRNHWLAVATGKSRSGLDEALATVELRGVFDATRTADETASKPDPRMLHELMRELGTEPERTLMVGDTTHDLLLAAHAGAASVAVSYGAHAHEDFAEHRPLHVARDVAELADWLAAHA
ncbi:MAG TPA: HAD-IA family hydrolase [Burkholderiaceae bacterium]|nr:HAD-IA family hydrolase [Burkholderiaceae bacterium]